MTIASSNGDGSGRSEKSGYEGSSGGASMPSAPDPGLVLFNTEEQSDIIFNVGIDESTWRFPAHSFIVAEASDVFMSIVNSHRDHLNSNMINSSSEKKPEIHVHCQPEIFHLMLSYIYKKEANVSSVSNALTLILVAHQFMLHDLTRSCLEFLVAKACPSNVLEILSWLRRPPPYNAVSSLDTMPSSGGDSLSSGDNILNELINKSYAILDYHAEEILKSSESLDVMDRELLMDVLSRDTLCLSSESVAFECIMSWASQQCLKQRRQLTGENRRDVLGQAIYSVRYLMMSIEDFMRGPYSSDILFDDEKSLLLSRLRTSSSLGSGRGTPSQLEPLPLHMLGRKLDVPRNYIKPCVESIKTTLKKEVTKGALNVEPRKKTATKKLKDGLSGFMICVIQLLD